MQSTFVLDFQLSSDIALLTKAPSPLNIELRYILSNWCLKNRAILQSIWVIISKIFFSINLLITSSFFMETSKRKMIFISKLSMLFIFFACINIINVSWLTYLKLINWLALIDKIKIPIILSSCAFYSFLNGYSILGECWRLDFSYGFGENETTLICQDRTEVNIKLAHYDRKKFSSASIKEAGTTHGNLYFHKIFNDLFLK